MACADCYSGGIRTDRPDPTGTVTRDGKTKTVPAKELVVGDVVELKVGDTVPADVRCVPSPKP